MDVKKAKYLWEKKTSSELQLWPSTSVEHYLAKPTLPMHLVHKNRRAKISAPEDLHFGILEPQGILAAALTEHNGNYYQSRADECFHVAVFTCSGSAKARIDRRNFTMRKGALFVAPAGTSYEFTTDKKWHNFWFHIENSKGWGGISGDKAYITKSACLEPLEHAVRAYVSEIYSPTRSLRLLEIYADLIAFYLHKEFEFGGAKGVENSFDVLMSRVRGELAENWTSVRAARELGISKIALDKLCLSKRSRTFAKLLTDMRMREARALLADGRLKISDIAALVGYATPFSLSKAFKLYHGKSPAEFSEDTISGGAAENK